MGIGDKKMAELKDARSTGNSEMPSTKNRKFYICLTFFLQFREGYQKMKKGDKGKKVFGVIVILAIIVSVFGGVVSADDLSGGLMKKVVKDGKE